MGHAPPLHAGLDDAVVFAGRLDHAPAFDDVMRHRLLAVDVFAGLAGPNGGQGMPVVRRRHRQRGDVLVLQDPANVLFHFRLFLLALTQHFHGGWDDAFVRVDQIGDLDVLKAGESVNQGFAPAVQSHDGQKDAVVGLVRGSSCGEG